MLIAVNTRFLIRNKLEGIGWFTYETMKRLSTHHPEHEFLFLFDREPDPAFIFSDNITPIRVWPPARHPYLWQYWFDHSIPRVFKKYKPDLFISTDGFVSLRSHVPTLLVIHDLGFEHYPEHTPGVVSNFYRKFTPKYARHAAGIVTVSAFSKNDIVKHYHVAPDKITVAYNGANEAYVPLPEEEKLVVRTNFTGGRPYFIYVGSVHPRKNVKNLLLAYDVFRKSGTSENKLLIAGRMAWKTEETERIYQAMQFRDDVLFTGHLQLHDLTRVVAAADAFVYPSLFEGFGIPVVEARYCGVPVITSNRSSLMETGGPDAIYFDPDDIRSISDALMEFEKDKTFYRQRAAHTENVRATFNWDKTTSCIESAIHAIDPHFEASVIQTEVA